MDHTQDGSELVRVVINRATWLRGEGFFVSKLLRESDGKMCCLGFACKTLGATHDDILGVASPIDVIDAPMPVRGDINKRFNGNNYRNTEAMMRVNDRKVGAACVTLHDVVIENEPQREQLLTELAKKAGLEFVFEG